MERFVSRLNIDRYRELLGRVTDEEQRNQILYLLAQEVAKLDTLSSPPNSID